MSVSDELRRIDEAIEETLERGRREQLRRTAKSRRTVYEKALESVRDVAGEAAMRDLGEWIRDEIRDRGDPPAGRQVRQRGAAICRAHGHEVSTNDWLGA